MVLLHALLLLSVLPISSGAGRLRTKFYLVETQMRINDALGACSHNYTDLVTIYDKKENMGEAKILVNGSNNCSLIGANVCTWSDGEPVTFINFSRNFTTEERCCGALTTDGKWECFNCTLRMYFMCYETDQNQPSINNSLIPENKTWFEAQLYCRKNHTDLVTIRNNKEDEQVKNAVKGNKNNSIWIGLQFNYSVAWTDPGHYKEECFTLLSNDPCKSNQSTCAALCYKSFIHVSQDVMSWEKALDYCSSQVNTSGLLRIESEDDQTETERELKRQKISGPVWVGLRQSRLFGFWIWSNGLYVGPWTNWKGGSAPEHQMSQHCGALEKVNGTFKWSDKDCRSEFRCLCEVK